MYWIQIELEMSGPISKLMILVRVQKLKLKEEGDMGLDRVYKTVYTSYISGVFIRRVYVRCFLIWLSYEAISAAEFI
jgi:hypothetical protein